MNALVCGTGAVAHLHALGYKACGVDIAAVWDVDPDRAAVFAQIHGGEPADSLARLADTPAEFASVCSPPPLHPEQAEALRADGRRVLVEKPVATSAAGFAALAADPGCVPVVQWRQGRALQAVRAAVSAGLLGPAPTAVADLAWHRGPHYFTGVRATRQGWGCGAFLSVGVHAVDALAWALGRDPSLVSYRDWARDGVEVETSAVAALDFGAGASGLVRVSFDAGADETRLTVCGDGVTATISGTDSDPTAAEVAWRCADTDLLRRLQEIEHGCPGATSPPLHIPFLAAVVAGDPSVPSIADVAGAHQVAYDAYTTQEPL